MTDASDFQDGSIVPAAGFSPAPTDAEEAAAPVFDEVAPTAVAPEAGLIAGAPEAAAPAAPAPPATVPRTARPPKPPGPGLLEACAWMLGIVIVQTAGQLFAGVVVIGAKIFRDGTEWVSLPAVASLVQRQIMPLLAIAQAVFLGAAVLFCWLRLRPGLSRRLPLTPVAWRHAAVLAALVLPLGIISTETYRAADVPWKRLVEEFPLLKALDETNVVEQMQELVKKGSWPVVLFAVAFVPALAEELIFRGVLGRGLVARWGFPAGVTLASLLFAAAHFHPVHVVGVIPIGIVLHLAYLSTRSFWSPMFLHFANNSLATVVVLAADYIDPSLVDDKPAPPWLLAAAVATTVTCVALLWNTRVQFLLPDGTEWGPGYRTADHPPPEVPARSARRQTTAMLYGLAGASIAAFAVAFYVAARR